SLPRIRGLGRQDLGGAARDRGWFRGGAAAAGQRTGVGCEGGGEISDRLRRAPSNLHPPGRRPLARVNGAAVLALARLFVGVEGLVERRQVLHQVLHFHLDAVDQRMAFEAIPFEGIELVGPRRLDHEADRAFLRSLRTVADMRRQQENLSFANGDVVEIAVVHDLEQHIPFELVEELLHRIVVIIRALVRPADDLYGHLAVLGNPLVAHRRLEQMLVLFDPVLKIEGVESSHVSFSFAQAADECSLRAPSFSPQVSNARRVASLSAGVSSSNGRRTAPPVCPSSSCQHFEWAWNFSAGRVRRSASRTGSRLSRTAFARPTSPRKARSVYSRMRRSALLCSK